jgi:hypothetical protein
MVVCIEMDEYFNTGAFIGCDSVYCNERVMYFFPLIIIAIAMCLLTLLALLHLKLNQ